MPEDAIELVEIALVLHQRGARQIIEVLHPARGEVGVHRLHQGEVFAQSDRHAGPLERMEETHEHRALLRRSIRVAGPASRTTPTDARRRYPSPAELLPPAARYFGPRLRHTGVTVAAHVTPVGGDQEMADLSLARQEALFAPAYPRRAARLGWVVCGVLMIAALLWPAIANRFPIVFHDTGGYLATAIYGNPGNGRAAIYGAFLWLGIPTAFWLNILVQAAATAWLVVLTLRTHGLGGRPVLALAVVAGLAVLTGLPWYAAQLLPDIWLPDAVLAVYLLGLRRRAMRRWERVALVAVIAFAMASHMGTLGVILGLVAVLIVAAPFAARLSFPRPTLAGPAIGAAAGVLLALTSNLILNGEFAFTRGGPNFLFGRILQTGIAAQYLDDNCPDPTLRLCAYRRELSPDGDNWLWDAEGSPLYKLGGWDAFEPEAARIVKESLRQYPLQHLTAFIHGTLTQLVMVETGEGLTPWTWHVHEVFEDNARMPTNVSSPRGSSRRRSTSPGSTAFTCRSHCCRWHCCRW